MTASGAPWDSVPPEEQLFVLITGANSGVGLGVAQRLIDDFLASRPPTAHLVLLPTTRSAHKSLGVIASLRAYAAAALARRRALAAPGRPEPDGHEKHGPQGQNRIHILSLPLDLCDIRGVYAFADRLARAPVSNPPGLPDEYLVDVTVPRLDCAVFNAAFGGWAGLSYPRFVLAVLRRGPFQAFTWPDFLVPMPDCVLNERHGYAYPQQPRLGEVFAACVFGHYLLAHRLAPLLARTRTRSLAGARPPPPARIVWCSTLDACRKDLALGDLQSFLRPEAYEAAKRLIDVLSLTAALPAARPHVTRYLTAAAAHPARPDEDVVPPRMYLTHPGVVASTLFPLPAFLFWAYRLAVDFTRWLGSPWHVTSAYLGAFSAAWIALSSQDELDHARAHRSKWGSACDRDRVPYVKATEVEGWGWDGRPETARGVARDTARGGRCKASGRKAGMPETTPEDIVDFEETGAQAWAEMEAMRHQWEKILQIGDFE